MDIVFDASTLILLAKIDLLQVVTCRYNAIIPAKVRDEVLASDSTDASCIRYLINNNQITVRDIENIAQVQRISVDFRIHAGEAEALALAMQLSTPLAADDGPAIKACKAIGIKFITAVHFIINAVQNKLISRESGLEKLRKLSTVGRYRIQIIQDAEKRIMEA